MQQEKESLKAWACYQINTVINRKREYFLKELDKLIALRSSVQQSIGQNENLEFYRGFILDPMVNGNFFTFDSTRPFHTLIRSKKNLRHLGIFFCDPT